MQSHSLAQPKRLGAPDPGVGRPDAFRAHRQTSPSVRPTPGSERRFALFILVKGGPAPLSHFPPKIGKQRTRFAAILFVPRPGGTTAGAPTGRTGRWAQPSGPRNLTLLRSQNGLERRLQPAPAAREGRGTRQPHPPRQPTRYGTADLRSARGPQGRNRGNPIPFTATRPGTPTSRAALPLRRSTPAPRATKTRRGALFHPEPRPATTRCAPDRRRSPGGRDHG